MVVPINSKLVGPCRMGNSMTIQFRETLFLRQGFYGALTVLKFHLEDQASLKLRDPTAWD